MGAGGILGALSYAAPVGETLGGFLNANQQANALAQTRQAAKGMIGQLGPEYAPIDQAVQAGMDPIFALQLMGGPTGAAMQTQYQRHLIQSLQAANPNASPEEIMTQAMPMLMGAGGDPSKMLDWLKQERELDVPNEQQQELQKAYQTGDYPAYLAPQMAASMDPNASPTSLASTSKLWNDWLASRGHPEIKRVEESDPTRTRTTETDVPYYPAAPPISETPGWTAPSAGPGAAAPAGAPAAAPSAAALPPRVPTTPPAPPGAPALGVPRMKAAPEVEAKQNQQAEDMIQSGAQLQNHLIQLGPTVNDSANVWNRSGLGRRIFDKYAAVNYGILPTDAPDDAMGKIMGNAADAKRRMMADKDMQSGEGLKLAGVTAEMITYNALANAALLSSMGTRAWQAAASHEGHIPVLTGDFWSIQTQIYNLTNQYKNAMQSRGAVPAGPFAMPPQVLQRLRVQHYTGPDGKPRVGYWVDPNAMD